jgi:hypothetical protein
MRPPDDKIDVEVDATQADVGSEGGSPGDVELAREHGPGTGSEAGETWRPTDNQVEPIRRDDTGEGRRSP